MSENSELRALILEMKKDILDKIESRNSETEKNINVNINNIKTEVMNNKEEIEKLNRRIDKMENEKANGQSYSESVKRGPKEDDKEDFLAEARNIIGIVPITDSDFDHYLQQGKDSEESLIAAVDDFLKLELKLNVEEIKDLGIHNITRPKKEETDSVYLHCKTEDWPRYLYCKAAHVKNNDVKVVPFLPPQLFN